MKRSLILACREFSGYARRLGLGLRISCIVLPLFASSPVFAQEVQRHGLIFEQWVRDTFFDHYTPDSYTQKWDIPAAANLAHGSVPVNPKAAKYRTPVDLGDALRQFDIDEPFILVIGYWRQEEDVKQFVNIVAARIEPETWRKLWGPVTRADLVRLDAIIKDRSLTPAAARAAAKRLKSQPPFSQATIVLNPKIDSKTQRRLQCSLRFADVFKYLAPEADPAEQDEAELWSVIFPQTVESGPREFNRE